MNDLVKAYFSGVACGALAVLFAWFMNIQPELTCEIAERKIWATQQCLRNRPMCESLSVEAFSDYHEIRYWAEENCPVSGDDFLSQSN